MEPQRHVSSECFGGSFGRRRRPVGANVTPKIADMDDRKPERELTSDDLHDLVEFLDGR
ncbi:hypothetical protein LBMAG52_34620 [Planctomycetia bacterium]|nr:hypothetical protein LBMAG52_34620 [Planctomycetia bacterium]